MKVSEFRSRIILGISLLIVAFINVFLPLADTAQAQVPGRRCAKEWVCLDPEVAACIPLPTTLPKVDPNDPVFTYGFRATTSNCLFVGPQAASLQNFTYGFRATTSNCGAYSCWIIFAYPCGPPLGVGVCSGEGESACNMYERNQIDGESVKKETARYNLSNSSQEVQ